MKCKKCGHENNEQATYCNECGKKLNKRSFKLKEYDYLKQNNFKVRKFFLLVVTALLLVMSIGSVSRHNAGRVDLGVEEGEVTFTQTSLHYLEGFRHFILGTSTSAYRKIVQEQTSDHPVGDTIASYKESYSHRNLIGYNLLADDVTFSKVIVILINAVLIFTIIGIPLMLFVYLCIDLQLKSDKKLSFEKFFLLSGLAGIFLTRTLVPAYSFHIRPSFNLILYIIISFIAFMFLHYLNLQSEDIAKEAKNKTKEEAIYSALFILLFLFMTSNFINMVIMIDGTQVFLGRISLLEASKQLTSNSSTYAISDSTIYNFFRNYDIYSNTGNLSWEYFLRGNYLPLPIINVIIVYLRLYLGLAFMSMLVLVIWKYNTVQSYLSTNSFKKLFKILQIIIFVIYTINMLTLLFMNITLNGLLQYERFLVIAYPSIASLIPIYILYRIHKRIKKTT